VPVHRGRRLERADLVHADPLAEEAAEAAVAEAVADHRRSAVGEDRELVPPGRPTPAARGGVGEGPQVVMQFNEPLGLPVGEAGSEGGEGEVERVRARAPQLAADARGASALAILACRPYEERQALYAQGTPGVTGSVGVIMPKQRFDDADEADIAGHVKAAAESLGRRLGDPSSGLAAVSPADPPTSLARRL